MGILIRLNPTVFDPGGIFENTARSRAVLHAGVGRNDVYAGKLSPGSQNVLLITAQGVEVQTDAFQAYMSGDMKAEYGIQLLDYIQRGYIQCASTIADPFVPMTIAAIRAYIAP